MKRGCFFWKPGQEESQKGQGTRDKGQGTRDKGQGTRDKGQSKVVTKVNKSEKEK